MSARVKDDPSIPLSRHKENVHLLWKIKYEDDDPELWQDILRNLPSEDAIVKRLNTTRIKLTGPVPKSRDDFNARPFLDKVIGGKNVLVLDSNDLPDTKEEREELIKNAFDHRIENVPTENQTFDDADVDDEHDEQDNAGGEEPTGTKIFSKRTLVFTTLTLLSLLSTELKASVDGTFKAICPNFDQLFILLVRICDSWVPVAYGFLPDRRLASYENFLLLILMECAKHNLKISLEKVYCDYELNIHKSFTRILKWIKIRGCYFHFTQKIWKQVQSQKFCNHYTNDSKFRKFVRCVVGLPFLPVNDLQKAVDWLETWKFDHPDHELFQREILAYITRFWINGPFPPQVWSVWARKRHNTNNHHESYNSRLNKMLHCFHPNPWILLMTIVKELNKSESDVDALIRAQKFPNQRRKNYQNLMEQRKGLKRNYKLKKISMEKFLSEIGALSLKSFNSKSHVSVDKSKNHSKIKKTSRRRKSRSPSPNMSSVSLNSTQDIDESVVHSESDSSGTDEEEENPYTHRKTGIYAEKEPTNVLKKKDKSKCPKCRSGFTKKSKFEECFICDSKTHKKCIKTKYTEGNFRCCKCSNNFQPLNKEPNVPEIEISTQNLEDLEVVVQVVENERTVQDPTDIIEITSEEIEEVEVAIAEEYGEEEENVLDKSINDNTTGKTFNQNHKLSMNTGYKNLENALRILKFQTSPTQRRTIGDGNCGPRALLNQILENKLGLAFKHDQHSELRHWVVQMTKLFVMSGQISWPFEETVDQWELRMSRSGVFVDNLWLLGAAKAMRSDIIIIPTKSSSAAHKDMFTWIRSGDVIDGQDTSGKNKPVYLGYLEESVHKNPHYQSVVPVCFTGNPVVKEIGLNGGYQFEKLSSCFNESDCADVTEPSFEDIGESTPLPIRARVIELSDGNEKNSEAIVDVPKKSTRKRKARPDAKTNAKKQKVEIQRKSKRLALI